MEAVGDFTFLGDKMSAGWGCDTPLAIRTRCMWVKFREYGELLYARFPLKLKALFIRPM